VSDGIRTQFRTRHRAAEEDRTEMAKKRDQDGRDKVSARRDRAERPDANRKRASGPGQPNSESRRRPVIEHVRPQVDGGEFPAKAAQGDLVTVEADAFTDGHDLLGCQVTWVAPDGTSSVVPMAPIGDDRWRGRLPVCDIGHHRFTVSAWVDEFGTWRRDLRARVAAGQGVATDLIVGSRIVLDASSRVRGADRRLLEQVADRLDALSSDDDAGLAGVGPAVAAATQAVQLVEDRRLDDALRRAVNPSALVHSQELVVVCDPAHARFASWYELFPRSASPDPGRPGTLTDVIDHLDYLERLQVDVLYLPPIHPIGRTNRKGRNGGAATGADDPGSPWAIGAEDGGHTSVHPELGTMDDFDRLVAAAAERKISVALDLAFQCSPDHPWVREHPSWFRHLPDGSIRFAENPPKRYQDIYPIDFDTDDWQALWHELADVVRFWIGHGVRIFRVDNPHTKPFGFWRWLIATIKAEHPEVIFLSEAFTRPRVMERLAKVGFTESYTYFTWRTAKWELESYLEQLLRTDRADYFRPNFWTNTPDILPENLQTPAVSAYVTRLVLAATMTASYGIYGPAFELRDHHPAAPGSEEYADSEKYAVRHWDIDRSDSLSGLVARMNSIRRSHPALQHNDTLRFHPVDNDQLLAYSKSVGVEDAGWAHGTPVTPAVPDVVLVVVNLDPASVQRGWLSLELGALGLDDERPFEVHDLLTDARYRWEGSHNFVQLDPSEVSAHVFAVRPYAAPAPATPVRAG
jgi:starch synthase (maltosyl-transferring)